MYQSGEGFVPDDIRPNTEVLVIGQNPGEHEEQGHRITGYNGSRPTMVPCRPQPFVGPTGYQLNKTFLPLAGLTRDDVSVANTIRCRWNNTNDLPKGKVLKEALAYCRQYDTKVEFKLTVAMGAVAWAALDGPGSITDWRGSLHPSKPVYATIHLADLYHDSRMDVVTRRDYQRIPKILRGEWPLPLPGVISSLEDTDKWIKDALAAPYVTIDTEYDPIVKHLILIGIGSPGIRTLQIDMRDAYQRPLAKSLTARLLKANRVVYHNALADVPILKHNFGLSWEDHKCVEDTMQAHAILWSELPHTLDFCASIYGGYSYWKHLNREDLAIYHQYDVSSTGQVWEALDGELHRDPDSKRVYYTQMRLLPYIAESMEEGISVNAVKVQEAYVEYEKKVIDADALAQSTMGWPINIRSNKQLGYELYDVLGLPVQKNHKTKSRTLAKDAVVVLRSRFLEVDPEEEVSEAHSIRRIEEGANPLLEAIVLAGEAQQAISHFLNPLMREDGSVVARVHPNIALHAQANAR